MRFDDLEVIRRYSRQYRFNIKSTDTGPDDRLTGHSLAAYIQEAASLDAIALGFGADRLDGNGIVWILIRHSLKFYDKPGWKDDIIIDTWTNGVSGIYALRDFCVSSSDGRALARATTSWIIADRNSKRPLRISVLNNKDMETFHYSALGNEAVRIRTGDIPADISPVLDIKVCASDIDRNGHVNNTRYIAWCTDALDAAGIDANRISGFDINYVSEMLKGETIEFFCLPGGTCPADFPEDNREFIVIGKNRNGSKISFNSVIHLS